MYALLTLPLPFTVVEFTPYHDLIQLHRQELERPITPQFLIDKQTKEENTTPLIHPLKLDPKRLITNDLRVKIAMINERADTINSIF